ncbi:hypothetical protein AB1K70_15010 [Bremerella sp. JC770]|uniref:hypothetical protein n=1 Tax=Bremerella sp. JC770 TaxID=3232137 RepID=UPI003457BA9C
MRRFLQYRTSTLLAVVALSSFVLALHFNRVHRAQEQAKIRRTLMESECFQFAWDWRYAADFSPVDKPTYPRWAEEQLGEDYLYSISAFDVQDNDNPESILRTASKLKQIRRIRILNSDVSPSCCRAFQAFPKLQWLGLLLSPVDDAGMHEIGKLKNLAILDIRNTQISDQSIDDISSLPNLSWLNVHGSLITEKGVEQLQERLPHCVVINKPGGFSVWPTIPVEAGQVAVNQQGF